MFRKENKDEQEEREARDSEFDMKVQIRMLQKAVDKDDELIREKYAVAKRYVRTDEVKYAQIMQEVNVLLSERDGLADKLLALRNDETTLRHRKLNATVDKTTVVHKQKIVQSINKNYEGYMHNANALKASNDTYKQIKSVTSGIDTSLTEKKELTVEQKQMAEDYARIAEHNRVDELFSESDKALKTVPKLRPRTAVQRPSEGQKKVPMLAGQASPQQTYESLDVHDVMEDQDLDLAAMLQKLKTNT